MTYILKIHLLIFALLSLVHKINAQVITTFAGTGSPGSIGDNGLAANAQLNKPTGLAFDSWGNLYVSEAYGYRIRRIDTLGIITTIAGTGVSGYNGDNILATSAQLSFPQSIAMDLSNNLYICDVGNERIRKINAVTGVITTVAGNGSVGYTGDNMLATATSLFTPVDIAIDDTGNLYIVDEQNFRIRKVNTSGIITTIIGTGSPGYTGDNGPAFLATVNLPASIDIDVEGNILISDDGNNVVRKVSPSDTITTIAGTGIAGYNGDNILANLAQLNGVIKSIYGIDSNIYLCDNYNYRIRKIEHSTGIITTIVGSGVAGYYGDNGLATSAKINLPYGLVFDVCGNLFIADKSNNRIRKVWFNTDTLPQVNIAVTPNDTVITGTQVTTTATATNHGTVTGYQWVKNGINTGNTNSSYTYTPVNGDSVYCIVTVRACTGRMYTDTTTAIHITVTGDAGVANTTSHTIQTHPNPVHDVLHVETTEAQQYVLHNLMGVAILQGTVDKNNSIDMRAIPTGIYLLQLTDAEGQREMIRVVKE